MEQFQNKDLENDDNHDMIDEEDPYEGVESLDSDAEEDFDMLCDEFTKKGEVKISYNTVAHQSEDNSAFEFPAHIKRKEEMVIEDVIKDSALPFLPAKSLVRFKSVCKDWDKWINGQLLAHRQSYSFRGISGLFCQSTERDPSFISLNPKAYGIPTPSLKFLPEPVVIVSTCNGLLCCRGEDNVYYICNPVNEEWKMLPKPSLYHGSETATVLAFEPSQTKFGVDYDLICAVTLLDHPVMHFEIYSSAKDSWRVSEEICCDEDALKWKSGGFYMKGMAYWEISPGMALAFDLKEEQCGIQPLPCFNWPPCGVLTEMRGELCYIRAYNNQENACTIDIYGDIDMKLKHTIPLNSLAVGNIFEECRALPCINSELLLILVGRKIYSYHLRDQKLELVSAVHYDYGRMRYLPYVNSLVSLY